MNLTWSSQHPLGESEQMTIWFYPWVNKGPEKFKIILKGHTSAVYKDVSSLHTADSLCDSGSDTSLLQGFDWSLGSFCLWNHVSSRAYQPGKWHGQLPPDLPPWGRAVHTLRTYQSTWVARGRIMMWSMGPPSTGAPMFPCQLKERKEKKLKNKNQTRNTSMTYAWWKIFCWWQYSLPYHRGRKWIEISAWP